MNDLLCYRIADILILSEFTDSMFSCKCEYISGILPTGHKLVSILDMKFAANVSKTRLLPLKNGHISSFSLWAKLHICRILL